jgi:hypothetical protein
LADGVGVGALLKFAITSQAAKCADLVRKEYKHSSAPNWFFIDGGGFMP